MDDLTNKYPKKRSRSISSIDGVSRLDKNQPQAGRIGFNRPTSYRPTGRVGDFSGQSGVIGTSNSSAIGDFEADVFGPQRQKRRFGMLRRNKRRQPQLDGAGRGANRKKPRRALKAAGVLAVVVVLAGGFLGAKGYINLHKIFPGSGGAAALQKDVNPALLRGEGDGRINILLLGRGGPGHEAPDLTDTLILASVDPISKEVGLISIPRDLYVTLPGRGPMKINQVFYTGKTDYLASHYLDKGKDKNKKAEEAGLQTTDKAVAEVLGVPVHYHGLVDFAGFEKAINIVGGVDVNVPAKVYEQMRIYGKPYALDVKKGRQHFDGFRALAYSRSRYTSAGGDFERSERQRIILVALKQKIFAAGTYSNPVKISKLLDTFGSHIQTNFGVNDLSRLYDLSRDIGPGTSLSVGLTGLPNNYLTTANLGGLSVVIPSAGQGNYKDIQAYVRNVIRDSFLKKENARVAVYNGTSTPGLATLKAEELRGYGYNVVFVGSTPTASYGKTIVVDQTGGKDKYTKRYLELRYKTSATNSLPDKAIKSDNVDFAIIIGRND